MNKRCIGFLAGCLLLLASSAKAAVGEGVQLGPALLFPVLSVTDTYNDNFRLASENAESGWVTSIAPSLRVVLPVRRFYLNAEAGLDFQTYASIDEDDSTDWFIGAAGGADFPGGLSFKIADKHEMRYLPSSQEYGAGEDSAVNNLDATVTYAIRDALRLQLSGTRRALTYDRSVQRERVETTVQTGVYWKFRPTISGLLEGSYAVYQYDSNGAQDGSATQIALGLSWDVTAKSTGLAKAGYQWKRYDDQSQALGTEDGSYYTLSAGVRHSFTPRTVLRLDLTRASQESDFRENPYYLRTDFEAGLTQRLTAKVYGRVGVRYARDEYPNTTSYDNPYDTTTGLESGERTDTTLGASVALGFDVLRWLSLELVYTGERRNSNFDTFDYDVNRVTLGAKAAF
ncbi:MAG: outer membrane beta-barrel protein [Candidatus Methylomirabilia bacterium]